MHTFGNRNNNLEGKKKRLLNIFRIIKDKGGNSIHKTRMGGAYETEIGNCGSKKVDFLEGHIGKEKPLS